MDPDPDFGPIWIRIQEAPDYGSGSTTLLNTLFVSCQLSVFWYNFDHNIFFGWQISTAIKKTPEKNALKAKLMLIN